MTLLCFLLDLRTIPPPLLRDLKQSLLQLANLYAVTCGRGERERGAEGMPLLRDRLGFCYLHKGRAPSSSTELKIVYRPGQNFSLRDFHHAVNNLPMDRFMPEFNQSIPSESGDQDMSLTNLLTSKALYTWGGHHVPKKVIIICTSLFANSEAIRKSLLGAAEQCITVEFVVLEQEDANVHYDVSEKLNGIINSISDLENCVLRRYLFDSRVMCGIVKRWLKELKDDVEEPLKAVFLFKNNVVGSIDQIYCNLFASSIQIVDGFPSCQTCRCHGYPIGIAVSDKKKKCCPLTCHELRASDLIDNAVRVGEQTVLFLPSFEGCQKLQRISAPITFSIIERTSMASLSEGVILGTSYVVTPDYHETEVAPDGSDKSNLNTQLFHGLRGALFHLDQGLVCSSTCNTDTMKDGNFQCFYVLQPSDKGPMLLRRLAGSEEILPIPEMSQANDHAIPQELEKSIQSSLSKIELREYNPLQHERGFHPKLNWLVKESLQFGTILPRVQMSPKLGNPNDLQSTILQHDSCTQAPEGEIWPNKNKEEQNSSCVTEEWEQLLIVDEMNDVYSSTCISNPKFQNSSLTAQTKPLDEKTSRILERLEAPKQQKLKATSPSVSRNPVDGQMKQPLVPFEPSSGRPLRPIFHTLKRKQR